MKDQTDPHARERILVIAGHDPPIGASPETAIAALYDVLVSIGDTCPESSPDSIGEMAPARQGRVRIDQQAYEPFVKEYDQTLSKIHGACKGC